MNEIELLIQQGKKIEAIKRYREQTGTGLKEAKDAIDAYEREWKSCGMPVLVATPEPVEMDSYALEQVKEALRGGNIIEAIKIYRKTTGDGLKEAKDAIDAMKREL